MVVCIVDRKLCNPRLTPKKKLSCLRGTIVFLCPRKRRWPSTAFAMFPEYDGINTSLSTDTM